MEGVTLGPLLLRWNGLLLALGIAFGALLSALEAKRRYQDTEIVLYLFTPVLVWGWLGARLWHVLTPPLSSVQLGLTTTHYLSHPLDILAFWVGGFGIPGALLGGTFGLLLAARKENLPFWELTDILAPGVLLAQVIGRAGNYFNQELYGLPTNLPWAIFIQPESRLSGYQQIDFYHPLFAYEIIFNVIGLLLLIWLARGKYAAHLPTGGIFLVYLIFTALVRFSLEFLRLDVALIRGVNANQVFFALLFALSTGLFLARRRLARGL